MTVHARASDQKCCPTVSDTLDITSEEVREMFEKDFEDMFAVKLLPMLMKGRAEAIVCADPNIELSRQSSSRRAHKEMAAAIRRDSDSGINHMAPASCHN